MANSSIITAVKSIIELCRKGARVWFFQILVMRLV